ncbi:type VII secretion protein EccCb [Streptomyces glomeratus]|uniref:FtsK domain-containing protein n=1 Tax=Streptomyces glomeratus TaxID=284452 RepID=A0ABP6LUL9_9ACTN|nr:type VII secretion protein EccCb [Streptomyces glomeratus]MCF1510883.1 type VII secretion protein EccCb [Streptomyces glomeratus]
MAGRRIALLVATDGYQDPGLNQLRAPARGATELGALLRDSAIGRFDLVRELLNRPKHEIEAAVEDVLSDRSPDDLVLLYFACHGVRNDADRLFFATLGTQLRRPHATAIPASFIHHLLDECEARTKIVLLDCCYSGLFHRGAPLSPAHVDVEAALAGRGTFVITASTALEYAYDGDQLTLDNSLSAPRFTAAVIEGLNTGLADLNRDGVITPEELYTYVHDTVVNQAGPEQTPTKSGQCEGNVPLAYAPWIDPAAGPAARAAVAEELALGSLLPTPVDTVDRGFICDTWEGASRLVAPIGRLENGAVDDLMCVDFSSRDGNAAVVGKLGSGKTTLLRSLIMSLGLTHTPREAEFYLLEGAVNRLGVLRSLPHVRTIAAPHEHDAVEAALTAVKAVLSTRRTLFRNLDIDSIEAFRALRTTDRVEAGAASDVFLVVDGWLDFCWEFPDFADTVHRLANTGLNYGVHLLVTARRWSDFSADLLGLLGTRLELALDAPEESHVDAALASGIAVGWALCRRRRFRVAVPRFDDGTGPVSARESLTETAELVRQGWSNLRAGPSRLLAQSRTGASGESFLRLFGIGNPTALDVPSLRDRRSPRERLTVPFAVGEAGETVLLDLKEAAQEGMGPHGLCVGAPGSGKSELLRTIVLGLALRHSAEELSFVLADFKGSSTFAGLTELPHIAGAITGLAGDLLLVARMRDVLSGELNRRQELLRSHGMSSAYDYDRQRATTRPDLPPLPALLVVIDEFVELLDAVPDVVELLVTVARLGRSLGVHLLLASQRLEEGKLRGLDTYLSYRIALRTSSATDSRAALGSPDAHHLPPEPGTGFLRDGGTGLPVRFKAAYVSGPVAGTGADDVDGSASLLEAVVTQLSATGPAAHRIWLPPLTESPTLGTLFGRAPEVVPDRGLQLPRPAEPLSAPFALVDRPFQQRRDVLALNFRNTGHALVFGGRQSGKSTALATLLLSFALTHTPTEVQFYCLDFGGGRLEALAGLPHVGGVSSRLNPERVRRTVADVLRVLDERERFFHEHRIESVAEYRERRAAGEWPEQPWGDVFLVIDGWGTVRNDFETLEPSVMAIALRGTDVGVHLLISAARGNAEVRPALRDCLGDGFELRLGDPAESDIDRRQAALVPLGMPGRGLSRDGLHLLTALPRLDDVIEGESLESATTRLVQKVREHWSGPPAPPVRTLPELVTVDELPEPGKLPGHAVAVGIDDTDLSPALIDFEKDPLFVAFGETESGKTSLLRMLAHQICRRYTPVQARLILVDYRRGLLGAVPEDHLLTYCATGRQVADMAEQLSEALAARVPGPDVTPEQLRDRSWYTGPDAYLLIDDYDLIAGRSGNPLLPLMEYLPLARDLGLRVLLARSAQGAVRASYEPFLQQMNDLGPQGVVLSGDPSEGPLLGRVKPSRRPPGRGTLVLRGAARGVQLACLPPLRT